MIVKTLFSSMLLVSLIISNAESGSIAGPVLHNQTNRLFIGGASANMAGFSNKMANTIIVFDIEKEAVVKTLSFDDEVSSFSVSNAGYLAVVLVGYGDNPPNHENMKTELRILDQNYSTIGSVHGISADSGYAQYDWDKSGTKIAYLTSTPEPLGHYETEVPTGTWLLDIKSGSNYKLCEFGTDVKFNSYDGNIYVRKYFPLDLNTSVYMYNISTKTMNKTDRRGLEFSNNGKYYAGFTTDGETTFDYVYDSNNENYYNYYEEKLLYKLATNNFFLENSSYLLTLHPDFYALYDMAKLVKMKPCTSRNVSGKILGIDSNLTLIIVSEGENKLRIESIILGDVIKSLTVGKQ